MMKLNPTAEYRLQGERNNRPRQPLLLGEKVYVIFVYDKKGFVESRITCLDKNNLDLAWEQTHRHVINNMVVLESNRLLASCMDGKIKCLDPLTGQVLWEYCADSNIGLVSGEENQRAVFSGIQGGRYTACLDTTNGELVWKTPNKGHSYIPTIHAGQVYNSSENYLTALNLQNGAVFWESHEPGSYLFNPMVVNGLVLASGHGLINAYDPASGKLVDAFKTGTRGSIYQVKASGDHCIYFGDGEGVFYACAVKPEGISLQWKHQTAGTIESFAGLTADEVLVMNKEKELWIFNRHTGETLLQKKIKGEAGSGISMENDAVYLSCYGGYVSRYALVR